MRFAPLLLLPLVACSSPGEEARIAGDASFRMMRFHDAYAAYSSIEEPDDEVTKLVEESRYRSILQSARDLVHVNRIDDALRLLDELELERPNGAGITEIRDAAYRRKAAELADSGERLLDDGFPEAALRTYREALRWNANNEEAQQGLRESERLAGARAERGEALYFEGLDQVLEGKRTQAHTSFAHAAELLGSDSRAVEQVQSLSEELAAELTLEARMLLDDGVLGGAWLVLSDAVRLDPANLDGNSMYAEVARELEARRLLNSADIHVRGGRMDAASVVLERVLEVTGETYSAQVERMSERAGTEAASRDYKLARACELDNQVVRAVALYQNILRATEGYRHEDLRLRVDNLQRRIDLASQAYTVARQAEASGNKDGYRQALEDCLELAGDYRDAYERYRRLTGE
jgi:tetratricopeptide (TPR) repeat protein